MKTVRIFNPPLHVLDNKRSVSDIDGLKIFKFYEHPKIRVPIESMKTTFLWYQALTDSIKSFEERKDNEGSHSRKGRIVRARTHSTCLIRGNQTLERYQD